MLDTEKKRERAILNNQGIYQSVLDVHGIHLREGASIYYSLEKTPPLYSNIATKLDTWKPDEIFHTIDTRFLDEKWESWSIKDSFQCLDLESYGFSKLFDAQWLYLESGQFKPTREARTLFKKIVTTEDLNTWIAIWGEGVELGKQIFKPDLLNDRLLTFVIGEIQNKVTSVALLNKTDEVFGISNFFVKEDTARVWSDLISYIYTEFGPTDVVGYERSDTLEALTEIGVQPVGDLTVWLKEA